jgi:hypothetical protein
MTQTSVLARTTSSVNSATPACGPCSTSRPTSASGAEPSTPNSKASQCGLELGPQELAEGKAVLVPHIPGTKEPVALAALVPEIGAALRADQQTLHDQALARREAASPCAASSTLTAASPITATTNRI